MNETNPYRLRVADVLTTNVITVSASDTLKAALELMVEHHLTALPVVDRRGHCAGIISASDIVEITQSLDEESRDLGRREKASYDWLRDNLADHDLDRRTVGEFMTDVVTTVPRDLALSEAAREMLRHRVHRLPVVDKHSKLVGIISTMDILTAFVEGAPRA